MECTRCGFSTETLYGGLCRFCVAADEKEEAKKWFQSDDFWDEVEYGDEFELSDSQ